MKIKFSDIFYCGEKNSGLYSDIFYESQSKNNDIAIYSSQSKILGLLPKEKLKDNSVHSTKQAIIMYRKGNAGTLFIPFHEKWSCSENAIPLILKEEYYGKIDLEYLMSLSQHLVYEKTTGKSDNANASWDMIKSIEIEYNKDESIVKTYKNLRELENFIKNSFIEIKDKKEFFIDIKSNTKIKLSQILKHTSRNDSLSEEGIYNKNKTFKKSSENITVLSGSFAKTYGKIPFEEGVHKVKNKPCIQVITRGIYAGKIRFIKKGVYATNTNSMLLTLRQEARDKLNIFNDSDEEDYLGFLSIYLAPLFNNFTSSSDLSVFALTEVLEQLAIPLIELNPEIKTITNQNEKLNNLRKKLNTMISQIKPIINSQIS